MPTTAQSYPRCRKLGLLRKTRGHDHISFPVIVSSAALSSYLGAGGYQEFIRHLHSRQGGRSKGHPTVGFAPASVEEWLKQG